MPAGKQSSKKNRFRHREKSAKLGLLFRAFSAPRLFSQPLLTEIGDARGQDASMMTRLASAPRGQGSREAPRRWRDAGRVVICVVGDLGRRCCRPRSSGDLPITWHLAARPVWRRSRNVSAHRHWGTTAGLAVKASPSSGPYSTPPAAACASLRPCVQVVYKINLQCRKQRGDIHREL
mgnify:CR=1 FL=1